MDSSSEKFPFNQRPNKKLSDYIIEDEESEGIISDLPFNTEDDQEISTKDIRICTDPASPFFMEPEGDGINLSDGFGSDVNNSMLDGRSSNGFNSNVNGSMLDGRSSNGFNSNMNGSMLDGRSSNGFNSNMNGSMLDGRSSNDFNSNINDASSKIPNVGDLPIGFRNILPKEEIEVLSLSDDKIGSENLKNHVISDDDRRVKPSKETTNKAVIALVTIGALLMMWYTFFAQPTAANSKQLQLKQNDSGSWDIRFTDMYQQRKIGTASEISAPSYSSTKASFHVSLSKPGDEITYNLTIKNNGSLNAKVSSIYVMPENNDGDSILYFVDGINVGDFLDAGKSTNMAVTAKFNSNGSPVSGVVKSVSVIINYVQR